MPAPLHWCMCCGTESVPVYRVFCRDCFGRVPWQLRGDVMKSYRVRTFMPQLWAAQRSRLARWINDERGAGP